MTDYANDFGVATGIFKHPLRKDADAYEQKIVIANVLREMENYVKDNIADEPYVDEIVIDEHFVVGTVRRLAST